MKKRKRIVGSRKYHRFEMYVKPEEKDFLVNMAGKCGISVSKLLFKAAKQYLKRMGYHIPKGI
jgi:hypothetical protein